MIPFITSRTSTWRLLPPRLAGGINDSTCAHSSSVRSLGIPPAYSPALLHAITQMGLVRHRAQDDQETDASQATGDQDRVAQDNARPHRENRRLGETDAERASELLRCLG